MRIRFLAVMTVCVFLAVVMNITGCKPKATTTREPNKPTEPATKVQETTSEPAVQKVETEPKTPPEPSPDDVLVTVNGVNITEGQLDAMLKPHFDRIARQAGNLPPEFIEQQKKMIRDQALEEMIKMRLLDAKVEQAGITVTDAEVDAEIARIISLQKPAMTLEQFKSTVEGYGYNFEQWKTQLRTVLGHQKLIAAEYPEQVKVTEADARAFYDKNKARYDVPEQVRASHILIKTGAQDPNTDPNEAKAQAKAKAEDLLKQIKEGADFADLAKEYSEGPSASRGGDLSFFRRGQMVPPFEKAAFALEVGKVSDIVETRFGYHIIKVTDRKEAQVTPFEEVKDQILAELRQRKLRELAAQYTEKLKAEAKIVYPPGKEPKPAAPPMPSVPAPAPR